MIGLDSKSEMDLVFHDEKGTSPSDGKGRRTERRESEKKRTSGRLFPFPTILSLISL